MNTHSLPQLTIEEYINQEQETSLKYEYHDGQILAMAEGTLAHLLLCGNIYSELRKKLPNERGGCTPVTSEAKLNIISKNSYVYPDAMVICGDIELSEIVKNAITNPTLVVEVLSKSTAVYDRGDKFYLYRQIPSLREYVLIEQEKAIVEVYYKQNNSDLWKISRYEGLSDKIKLQSLDIEIAMAELYYNIEMS